MDIKLKKELEKFALQIRIAEIEEFKTRGFGHLGGSLSITDVLAVLYGGVMRYDANNPTWPERDKFVCSKGHAGPAVYATLALKGFFPVDELATLNRPGTNLPSHCDRLKTPGIDMTTGSLGQGTSLAVGMALGAKMRGYDSKVYLMCGDGEIDEGQVWEAAMFTAAKNVTNLIWMVDNNKKQLDGTVAAILDSGDLEAKFASFGFDAVTINGNDVEAVYEALTKEITDKPLAIILDTVKGCGIKEVEDMENNHAPNIAAADADRWLKGLREELAAMEKEAE